MNNPIVRLFLSLIAAIVTMYIADSSLFVTLGYLVFFYISFSLVLGLGKKLPIRELMSFIVFLQLFISPLITYQYFDNRATFTMYVPQEIYMYYILPALYAFTLGLFISFKKRKKAVHFLKNNFNSREQSLGILMIVTGLIFSSLRGLVPPTFFFVFHLAGLLRFVGVFIIVFSNNQLKWVLILLVFGEFSLTIIRGGIFYDLFVWLGFLYMFLEVRWQSSYLRKITFFLMGFGIVYMIQIVKSDYRQQIWSENKEVGNSREDVFLDVASSKLQDQTQFASTSNLDNFVSRLNTGWIISKVMEHTPLREPFTGGDLLVEDLRNVLLPRFLFPNKASTGGQQNRNKFHRFTGAELREDTTMRIGAFADAYVNFGVFGGWICMFALGLLFNSLLNWFYKKASGDPKYLLWIPFVFSYAIRMSDFQVILNFTFKALIFFLLSRYMLKLLFPMAFTPREKEMSSDFENEGVN